MGLLTRKIAKCNVAFSGIQDYANSEDPDVTISATVAVEQRRQIGGKEPLPMFGALGATRLLSMLRREPQYVVAFMTLVDGMVDALMGDEGGNLAAFTARGCVVTDPALLAAMVGASSGLGGFAGDATHSAELNISLPSLVGQLPSAQERATALELHEARNGMGSVRFKFPMKSANALTTVGAWTATVEHLVTTHSREAMAVPIGQGLKALGILWERLEYPPGLSIAQGREVEAMLSEVVASNTPN